jgi:Tol biopolymer transport system component/DNA-binding winged helix-turn-helix (wHTH) protein
MDTQTRQLYAFGDFRLDAHRRLLLRLDGEPVPLTPKAFETLLILVRRHGSVVEKDELLREVWPDTFVEEATLAQNVFTLRRALGQGRAEPRYIETVPKHGYRFVADVRELRADLVPEKHAGTHVIAEESEVPDATAAEASAVTKSRGLSLSAVALGVRRHPRAFALGASVVVIAAALLFFKLYGRRPALAPFERMRLSTLTEDGEVVRAAISPDGKYVVTARREGAREGLWVRQTRGAEQVQVVAPADVHFQGLTFSTDGAAVFYVAYERNSHVAALYRVGVLGGTPARVLVDIDSAVAFSPDGHSLAFVRDDPQAHAGSLMVAGADGTGARPIATRHAPEYFSTEGPSWSPDGREVACAVGRTEFNRSSMGVVAVRTADGAERMLTPPRWDFVGQVAYTSDGVRLLLDAWDSSASLLARQIWQLNAADGTARRITNDLNSYHGLSLTADDGALVSVRATRATNFWLAPGDAPAEARQITSGTGDLVGEVMGLAWTPDGRLVYGSNAGGDLDVWVMDADGRNRRQLTTTAQPDVKPSVSPDGRRIVFVSWRTGTSHLWRMDADGSNLLQLTDGAAESYPQVSPDGRWVVYLSAERNSSSMWKVSIEGGEPVRVSDRWSMTPTFSPDGKRLACFYGDEASGAFKLALFPSDGGDPVELFDLPQTVSLRAGLHWTADGGALRYVDNGGGVSNIWEQRVAGGTPKRLTDFTSNKIFRLAWSRDGRQLAFERGAEFDDATLISDFK